MDHLLLEQCRLIFQTPLFKHRHVTMNNTHDALNRNSQTAYPLYITNSLIVWPSVHVVFGCHVVHMAPNSGLTKTVNWRPGLDWRCTRPLAVSYSTKAQVELWAATPWLEGISQCYCKYLY